MSILQIIGIVCLVGCLAALVWAVIAHAKDKKVSGPVMVFLMCFLLFIGSGFLSSQGFDLNAPGKDPAKTDKSEESERSGGVEIDKGLLDVDITIPASFFQDEDMSAFDSDAYAKENGYSKAVVNADGSITVTMSKSRHKEIIEEISTEYDKQFSQLVGAEDTPYITNITRSKNFDQITMEVDRTGYENELFDVTPLMLGMSGMMYQTFSGDALHVEIDIKDSETGEEIHSVVYPDAFDANTGEME